VSDAKEDWREKHRTQRVRARKTAPARRVAGPLLLAVAVVLIALAFVIHWALAVVGVVVFYIGLRAAGQRPFEGGGGAGGTDGFVP
jgi:hypothetical protein